MRAVRQRHPVLLRHRRSPPSGSREHLTDVGEDREYAGQPHHPPLRWCLRSHEAQSTVSVVSPADPDRVLAAAPGRAVEPAVERLDDEALVRQQLDATRATESQASDISDSPPSPRTRRISVRAASSQSARSKIPGSRSSQRPCVSAMSSAPGVKTSNTKRPSRARAARRTARSAARRSSSVSMCSSERNGQMTSGNGPLDRRVAHVAEAQVDERSDARRARPARARRRASPPRSRRRSPAMPADGDRHRDPAGADAELDDRPAGAPAPPRRRSRRPRRRSATTGRRGGRSCRRRTRRYLPDMLLGDTLFMRPRCEPGRRRAPPRTGASRRPAKQANADGRRRGLAAYERGRTRSRCDASELDDVRVRTSAASRSSPRRCAACATARAGCC